MIESCQSQKIIVSNNAQKETVNNKNYFSGRWRLSERNYLDGEKKKTFLLHACEKKYNLVFEEEQKNIFLTKNFFSGKNCEVKSNSGKILITINDGFFSYLEGDLRKTERYLKLSEHKFSIIYNEILDGKVREIQDTYEKF